MEPTAIKQMVGYENLNFRISTDTANFTLKVYSNLNMFEPLLQETNALLQIHGKGDFSENYPKPVKFSNGEYVQVMEREGRKEIMRMLTYLEGTILNDVPRTPELLRSLGNRGAELRIARRNRVQAST